MVGKHPAATDEGSDGPERARKNARINTTMEAELPPTDSPRHSVPPQLREHAAQMLADALADRTSATQAPLDVAQRVRRRPRSVHRAAPQAAQPPCVASRDLLTHGAAASRWNDWIYQAAGELVEFVTNCATKESSARAVNGAACPAKPKVGQTPSPLSRLYTTHAASPSEPDTASTLNGHLPVPPPDLCLLARTARQPQYTPRLSC